MDKKHKNHATFSQIHEKKQEKTKQKTINFQPRDG